jgi:hypothetical protein
MVTCIFCGLLKLASTEDVIPKWVRYALDLTTGVTIQTSSGATTKTQHLVVTLSDMVCETCNTGWMHDLEEKVRPFLKPLLKYKNDADLNITQQRDLARWAVMKVFLMEYVRRKRYPLRTHTGYAASEPELAWLMREADPPPRSRVWLGAFDAENKYAVKTGPRLLETRPLGSAQGVGGSVPMHAHVSTLTIGCLLFQVFSLDFVVAEARSVPQYDSDAPWPYSQALTRIWPIKEPTVHWPTTHHVTNEIFDKVVSWGRPDAQASSQGTV